MMPSRDELVAAIRAKWAGLEFALSESEVADLAVDAADAVLQLVTVRTCSRENEPPAGTWVKDRFGGASQRNPHGGGWGQPGCYYIAQWGPMWDARGPLMVCGPWGREL